MMSSAVSTQPRPVATIVLPASAEASDPAIQGLIDSLATAWNAHDAQAFAARFLDDGSFANILGMTSFDKAGFLRQHERIFSTIYRNSRLSVTTDRIKMLREDVALVDTTTVLSGFSEAPPGIALAADGAIHTKLEMVLLRQADGWHIASFHNVAVGRLPPSPPPSR